MQVKCATLNNENKRNICVMFCLKNDKQAV